jgi:hypothetical protein
MNLGDCFKTLELQEVSFRWWKKRLTVKIEIGFE